MMEGFANGKINEGACSWELVREGLCGNPRDYKWYRKLGDYYQSRNLKQAWICYENALFYCDNGADRLQIKETMGRLAMEQGVSLPKTAIVILSWNLFEYTKLCIESIRQTVPESARQIIVVDNGSKDGSVEWLREQKDLILIENKENKGFPAGCNQGIAGADKDADIFLLNNDTVLPENALFWLRMGLYESEKNGTAGSISNCAGGNQRAEGLDICGSLSSLFAYAEKTNVPMKYPYEKRLYLIGFALLIKRTVWEQTGILDERFTPGNFEDNDYGMRVLKAGYRNVLCKNSFIIHFGSKSFEKHSESYWNIIQVNGRKLDEKWGFPVGYYQRPRLDLVAQIEEPEERQFRVLDVGCGLGAFLGYVQGRYPGALTYGVELSPQIAALAAGMGEVVCGDIEHMELPWPEDFFDYLVFGNVLEYLEDPRTVLSGLSNYLKKGGRVIVSVPNVKHYTVMLPLLFEDRLDYGGEGILDGASRRFYTGKTIGELIAGSGYQVEKLEKLTRGEDGEQRKKLEGLLSGFRLPDMEGFFTYQYLVRAVKP